MARPICLSELMDAPAGSINNFKIKNQQWTRQTNGPDGSHARLPQFLIEEARPECFCKVTSLDCTTFDALVSELWPKDLLIDSLSVWVEEHVLIFLQIAVSKMQFNRQHLSSFALITFCLYCSISYFHEVIDFLNLLGALDGVLIPVTVPLYQQVPH
ncbi:uncharacterized protein VP01_1269g2 [Puccinia sorghi]|uniref:Uncharacterized protein n=1 Tax=Puccinia sorghi TaxID=27349 RepID=A0A0L6VQI6_9BASI|nr:uncharacterized protein VP01_1269g2 [Puccinia sorghi]